MVRTGILFILTLFIGTGVFAQPPGGGGNKNKEKREKIHAQKIAFISTEVDLTPDEAQKFWPVYNQYEAEIEILRTQRRKYHKELRKSENLSDERAYELFELIFKSEKKESDIRLNYLKEFSDLLGKKKAAAVFIAEEKFKRELLKKLKKNGGNPPPPGHDRP
ncbi:MAG: hypothetical protein GQ574_05445 [Crocinitomix sp.]|nr:hypothetical protein [Crocinitomix sp.]